MSNITTLPTAWASSPSLAKENKKRMDELEAAQALMQDQKWQRIAEDYRLSIGQQLQPWQLVDLATYPVEPLMIHLAIHQTKTAPRPTFFYLRAILMHCCIDGCYTAEAYHERNARHRAQYDALYANFDGQRRAAL